MSNILTSSANKTFVQSVVKDEEFKSASVSDKWVEHFQNDCNAD
jgi:hypothetical protein